MPVVVKLRKLMSPEQRRWLRTTRVHVRRIAFHGDDDASEALYQDPLTLVGAWTRCLPRLREHEAHEAGLSVMIQAAYTHEAGTADCRHLECPEPDKGYLAAKDLSSGSLQPGIRVLARVDD